MSRRVLMVDDEPRILDAFRRTLRGRFEVHTATSGAQALVLLEQSVAAGEPFPVVVSDMMMPSMNGAELLARARTVAPDAVQLILSGQADLVSTISAVNNGNLFRFLTKPCDTEDLARALDDALRQHRLVTAERDLLERTLNGAVDVLTELLSLAGPVGLHRTAARRVLVDHLAQTGVVPAAQVWELRLAAMLGQIGCLTVPAEVLERAEAGAPLTGAEQEMLERHPLLARDLLRRIPRLEQVAEWVGEQPLAVALASTAPADGGSRPTDAHSAFLAMSAFLSAYDAGEAPRVTARRLVDAGGFSQALADALVDGVAGLEPRGVPQQVRADQLRAGMVLLQDVVTLTGLTLVRRGDTISQSHRMHLANFAASTGLQEPIAVLAPAANR